MRQVNETEYQTLRNLEQDVRDMVLPANVIEESTSGHDYSHLRKWIAALDKIRMAEKDSTNGYERNK